MGCKLFILSSCLVQTESSIYPQVFFPQGKTPGADRNIRGKKAVWFSDIFHAVFFYCAYIYKCTHTYTQPDAAGHRRTHECTRTYTHKVHTPIRIMYATLYATPDYTLQCTPRYTPRPVRQPPYTEFCTAIYTVRAIYIKCT